MFFKKKYKNMKTIINNNKIYKIQKYQAIYHLIKKDINKKYKK